MKIETTTILGAGGWGTALAALWAKDGRDIVLWGHCADRIERLKETRENNDYLPGVKLPANVRLTSNISDGAASGLIVFVVPSTAFRSIAATFVLLSSLFILSRTPSDLTRTRPPGEIKLVLTLKLAASPHPDQTRLDSSGAKNET